MKGMKAVKVISLLLCVALTGALAWRYAIVGAAVENEKDTGVRWVHVSDSGIENATLAIGSHLIHINGLTDSLYAAAVSSSNEFSQDKIYYKSELAGGQWYEITEASSIADITSAGRPVNKEVIEALKFTHKTDSKGVTIDLRTNQEVSIYNAQSPYELELMKELEPLKIQYQALQERQKKSPSDTAYIAMIARFFARGTAPPAPVDTQTDGDLENKKDTGAKEGGQTSDKKETKEEDKASNGKGTEAGEDGTGDDKQEAAGPPPNPGITDAQTAESDKAISGLETYKTALAGRGKPAAWTAAVDTVMEQEDARRRVHALTILDGYLDELMDRAGLFRLPDKDDGYEVKDDFVVNPDVISAIGEAKQNVQTSIASYTAKILEEGSTVASQARYRYSNDLIDSAKASDTDGCDVATEKLVNLDNVLSDRMADIKGELGLLQSDLVEQAYAEYAKKLSESASQDYLDAVAGGASQSVKSAYLLIQKDEVNAARAEYQTMIEKAAAHMDSEAAQDYLRSLIDQASTLKGMVPADDTGPYKLETLAEYMSGLRKTLADVVKSSSDSTEMDKLRKEKDELEKHKQNALDSNDLKEAKRLDALLEAKQKDIDSLLNKLADTVKSPNSSEADKAKALALMGDGNTSSALNSLADSIASGIRNQNTDDFDNDMAAFSELSRLDPDVAKTALDGIKEAVSGSPTLDAGRAGALLARVGDMEREINAALKAGGKLDANALMEILSDALGNVGSGSSESTGSSGGVGSSENAGSGGNGGGSSGAGSSENAGSSGGVGSSENAGSGGNGGGGSGGAGSSESAGSGSNGGSGSAGSSGSVGTGGSGGSGDAKSQAAAILALMQYGDESGNTDAKALALSYLNKLAADGNPYIYKKYNKDTGKYVSLRAVSNVMGYRYIFDDAHLTVTLSKGKDYYTFTANQGEYGISDGKTQRMGKSAGFMSTLYIAADDSKKIFGADAEYIAGADYAVLVTDGLDSRIREYIERMKEREA